MEGVGTPVEVQEMSTESPSRTVTVGPLMAVVLAFSVDQRVHTCNVLHWYDILHMCYEIASDNLVKSDMHEATNRA